MFDPRLSAIRDDLADERLRDAIDRPHYAAGEDGIIVVPIAPCRRRPASDAPLDTEFLHGEPVRVFDRKAGWAWVQSLSDSYVGYTPAENIGPPHTSTHRVSAPLALPFPSPSIKVPPRPALPLGASVHVVTDVLEGNEHFHMTADGAFILRQHLALLDAPAPDWVAVAEEFCGAPYLWGGKSWDGIDCSGLIQLSLAAAGISAQRDSDMQLATLGAPLSDGERLRRGDLVFWKGHLGVMRDAEILLHANGFHMKTASEPVAEAIARLERLGLPVLARKRVVG
ncbi:MAG: NlpC/P60 family protein [Pseudomonadota bacterium]